TASVATTSISWFPVPYSEAFSVQLPLKEQFCAGVWVAQAGCQGVSFGIVTFLPSTLTSTLATPDCGAPSSPSVTAMFSGYSLSGVPVDFSSGSGPHSETTGGVWSTFSSPACGFMELCGFSSGAVVQ